MTDNLQIYTFTVGDFAVNNYLVHSPNSKKAVLFDAGEETDPILAKIHELQLELVYLINTHGHSDHIAGNSRILQETGARLLIHRLEEPYLSDPSLNLSGFLGIEINSPPADRLLQEGDRIQVDDIEFEVLHTPGHSPGHISLVCGEHAFVGDVIFHGSIGRSDFPGSSGAELIQSIRSKIYRLPDQTNLYPGHGPVTRVGIEKESNPFVSM
jgi:glyoxylase-like metal-dependent hydrolase (beta-lactamase superfamily II)